MTKPKSLVIRYTETAQLAPGGKLLRSATSVKPDGTQDWSMMTVDDKRLHALDLQFDRRGLPSAGRQMGRGDAQHHVAGPRARRSGWRRCGIRRTGVSPLGRPGGLAARLRAGRSGCAALAALVAQGDRVLMDLRSFGASNAGCTTEIQHLVHHVPLTRCLCVIDTDDRPRLPGANAARRLGDDACRFAQRRQQRRQRAALSDRRPLARRRPAAAQAGSDGLTRARRRNRARPGRHCSTILRWTATTAAPRSPAQRPRPSAAPSTSASARSA